MAANRTQETQHIHKIYADFYRISGGLAFVILGIWIGSLLFSDGYATNVYTELLSVVATIVVLDQINQWRDKQNLKARLMNEVKSPAIGQATAALVWLRRENWIATNSFKNSDLQNVNWANAYIGELNFESSILRGANLQNVTNEKSNFEKNNRWQEIIFRRANLRLSNLSGAKLAGTNFREADLYSADLSKAYLRVANFSFANLRRAKLHDTVLTNVSLVGANLANAELQNNKWIFNDGTRPAILPDGEYWTAETDIEKFTNPDHPDFEATLEKINTIRADNNIEAIK